MIKFLLFLSLFLLFYSIIIGRFPDFTSTWEKINSAIMSIGSALAFFVIGNILFMTPVSGIIWAILGWFVPSWIMGVIEERKQRRLRSLARDFITSSSGLYAVGQQTSGVIRTMAEYLPDPLGEDFGNMLGIYEGSPHASFPKLFNDLSIKRNINELKAVSMILAASERVGGPVATSKGLKRLGNALRQRSRLAMERSKAMLEPKISAVVTILILTVGLLLDATIWKDYFQGLGVFIMAASSLLVVGLIFLMVKLSDSRDLI
jgi:tight adherence protein B